MEKPWKVVAAFIGVFIAGAVFGGFFTLRNPARRAQAIPPRPPVQMSPGEQPRTQVAGPQVAAHPGPTLPPKANQITPQIMRQLTKSLKLTLAEREKIQPIVGRAGEDFQRLREEETRRREEDVRRRQENLADVARANERMYVDVSNALTDEKRVALQKMRERVEAKFQAERKKRAEAAAAEAAQRAAAKAEAEAAAKTAPEGPK